MKGLNWKKFVGMAVVVLVVLFIVNKVAFLKNLVNS